MTVLLEIRCENHRFSVLHDGRSDGRPTGNICSRMFESQTVGMHNNSTVVSDSNTNHQTLTVSRNDRFVYRLPESRTVETHNGSTVAIDANPQIKTLTASQNDRFVYRSMCRRIKFRLERISQSGRVVARSVQIHLWNRPNFSLFVAKEDVECHDCQMFRCHVESSSISRK